MSLTPQQAGYVGFAGNVVTAVCLVFVNKVGVRSGPRQWSMSWPTLEC